MTMKPSDYALVLDYDYVKDRRRRRGYEIWIDNKLAGRVRRLESGAWCANRVGVAPADGAVDQARHKAIAKAFGS